MQELNDKIDSVKQELNGKIEANRIELLTEVRLLNNSVKSRRNMQYLVVPFSDGTFPAVDLTSTEAIMRLSKPQLLEILSKYWEQVEDDMTRVKLQTELISFLNLDRS